MDGASNDRNSNSHLEAVAEIARRLAEADDLDELLDRIVALGVEYLAPADGASLMLIGAGGRISVPAFSSKVAYDCDMAQFEVNEGPAWGRFASTPPS
jgi:hypothetical protein